MARREPVSTELLVAGGGLGGLTAALALGRRGHAVTVAEQAPEFIELGAGIQLGPNVVRMFDRLGLLDRLYSSVSRPSALILRDAVSGDDILAIPLGEAFVEKFGYPYVLAHRADLQLMLVDACRANGNISLLNSMKLTGFEDDGEAVTASFEDGASIRSKALIGCDGVHSRTRQVLLGDGPARPTGHVAYRAVARADLFREEDRPDAVVLWGGPKLHLAHYHVRGDELVNMGAVFESRKFIRGEKEFGGPDELHEMFSNLCPRMDVLFEKINEERMWVLLDRDPIEDWNRGRVALLGDAAHPTLQYLAQGAGMAIEDGLVLAQAVAATPNDLQQALTIYSRARSHRAARVVLSSRLYARIYHVAGDQRALRNRWLKEVSAEDFYRAHEWLYAGIPDRLEAML